MTRERYFAIRIGDPRRHTPYFMLDPHRIGTPWLFANRANAAAVLKDHKLKASRVIRVTLHEGKCK